MNHPYSVYGALLSLPFSTFTGVRARIHTCRNLSFSRCSGLISVYLCSEWMRFREDIIINSSQMVHAHTNTHTKSHTCVYRIASSKRRLSPMCHTTFVCLCVCVSVCVCTGEYHKQTSSEPAQASHTVHLPAPPPGPSDLSRVRIGLYRKGPVSPRIGLGVVVSNRVKGCGLVSC